PPTRAGQAGRARVDRRGALLRGRDDALVDVLHARGVHLQDAAVVRPEAVELVLDVGDLGVHRAGQVALRRPHEAFRVLDVRVRQRLAVRDAAVRVGGD